MKDSVHLDFAVARRILAGDEVAFRKMFDQCFPRLYRFMLSRLEGDHETARDLVQQTFCRAIEKLDKFRGEAALYTWLFQIARNTLNDYYRYTSRETSVVTAIEDSQQVRAILETLAAPLIEEPETGAWRSEVRRLVHATVDMLPERYAQVLEWKYIDGQPVKTIAEKIGVSPKAAESLLTRARETFRRAIIDMASDIDALSPPGRG